MTEEMEPDASVIAERVMALRRGGRRIKPSTWILEYYLANGNKPDYPANLYKQYKVDAEMIGYTPPSYTSFYKTFYYLHELGLVERTGRKPSKSRGKIHDLDKNDNLASGRSYYKIIVKKRNYKEWEHPYRYLYTDGYRNNRTVE